MDGSHAGGCSLIGLAITALMIRLMWMASPPFNSMTDKGRSRWKIALVTTTVLCTVAGGYMLSTPVDELTRQAHEDGFRFN